MQFIWAICTGYCFIAHVAPRCTPCLPASLAKEMARRSKMVMINFRPTEAISSIVNFFYLMLQIQQLICPPVERADTRLDLPLRVRSIKGSVQRLQEVVGHVIQNGLVPERRVSVPKHFF